MRILRIVVPLLTFGLCAAGILHALGGAPLWPWMGELQSLLFGRLALASFAYATAVSVWCFLEALRRSRAHRGYPFLVSACFAAAATTAILALQVLSSR